MIYAQLFWAFLQIGALSFGGGYAAMPLIQGQVIEKFGWLTVSEFTDLVAIAEMTPGPIAINSATFVGNQIAGIGGAVCATLGVVLVPTIFVSILAFLYNKYRKMALFQSVLQYLRPAIIAMIFTAGLTILVPVLFRDGRIHFALSNINFRIAVYFVAALIALRKWKMDPIKTMVACGVVELIIQSVMTFTA